MAATAEAVELRARQAPLAQVEHQVPAAQARLVELVAQAVRLVMDCLLMERGRFLCSGRSLTSMKQ